MCGFAGIFASDSSAYEVDSAVLTRMSDVIAHRGPDDSGLYTSPDRKLGLAFRRLSIIDLSPAGHQPMSDPTGRVWIVFNGEIYNHLTIRRELEAAGYIYRSKSDTETLLYAYMHWGERFVERLEGMFAIALWDGEQGTLRLYRDRIGIKPLYYTQSGGVLVFGSEIKSLLQHGLVHPAVDEQALYHYLTFIHTPAPMTLFAGIRKLEAGHFLRIDREGGIEDTEYWDMLTPPDPGFDYNDEEAVALRIRKLFTEAVEKRMMSDVPFGVFLSGGIDSSANVAFMAELMNRPVDTFTVAIKGQEDTNEFRWARRISELFGTNHHEVLIDDSGFLGELPRIIYHQDEPLADPVCFPLYHVSKLARDNGTIVIQVGEGSDEQFAGYQSYLRAQSLSRWSGPMALVPRMLKSAAYGVMSPILEKKRVDYRQNVVRNLFEGEPVFWGNAVAFYENEKRRLISPELADNMRSEHSYDLVRAKMSRAANGNAPDPLRSMIYWEMKHRLAELLLMRVDKITMSTSIEARVPFLDHKMVEFSMNIPSRLKTKNGVTKYILKKALRGILPNEIIDRKKIGFAGSGKNMLTPEIFRHARSITLEARHGYFNKEYLRVMYDEYEKKRINYTPQIWALYNFELWHRMWIEGENLQDTMARPI
jgi:asparagine synthase (glutamine-hydrolysing)